MKALTRALERQEAREALQGLAEARRRCRLGHEGRGPVVAGVDRLGRRSGQSRQRRPHVPEAVTAPREGGAGRPVFPRARDPRSRHRLLVLDLHDLEEACGGHKVRAQVTRDGHRIGSRPQQESSPQPQQ
jgi:hypothetical protein